MESCWFRVPPRPDFMCPCRRARQHRRRTECHDHQEARNPTRVGGPETGRPTPPCRETLRPRREETLTRWRARGEVPATKAGAGAEGSKLWRGEPHEGSDGRDRKVSVQNGLVTGTRPWRRSRPVRPARVAHGRRDRTDGKRGERQEGMAPERGTHRDEGNTLKGESQGRSGTFGCR